MALEKQAVVEIGTKGAEQSAAAARSALQPWGEYADKAKAKFSDFRREVGSAIGNVVSDLGRVATVGASISFAGAVQGVQSFEKATAQLATAARRDVELVRKEYEALGTKLGEKPETLANYVSNVGRVTYDFEAARGGVEAFKKAATDWNRPLEAMGGLQVAFQKLGIKDAEKGLAQIRANAEALGTTGGPAALADQVERLASVWDRVKGGAGGGIGIAAELGKGLSPAQAQQVQQQVLGEFTGDTVGWERFLRRQGELGRNERVTDERGQIKNLPEYMGKLQRAWRKTAKSPEEAEWLAQLQFGTIGGSAFMDMNADNLATLARQQKQTDALKRYSATDAGRRDIAGAKQDASMRDVVGSNSMMGGLNLLFREFAADHPILGKLGELGGAAGASFIGSGLTKLIAGGAIGAKAAMMIKAGAAAAPAVSGASATASGAAPGAAMVGGGGLGAFFAPLATQLLYGSAWAGEAAELGRRRPQLAGEMAAQFQTEREGRVQAIVRAAERSGGTAEGFKKQLGAPLMAQIANDPRLQAVAQGMVSGQVDLSALGAALAPALKAALAESPLKVHVEITDSTTMGVEAAQQEFEAQNGQASQ